MINITIRNIPDVIINKIRILSSLQRRSLNNEILTLLEKGLSFEINEKKSPYIPKEIQISLWKKLAGSWKDDRSTDAIIEDIYSSRTVGRDIDL